MDYEHENFSLRRQQRFRFSMLQKEAWRLCTAMTALNFEPDRKQDETISSAEKFMKSAGGYFCHVSNHGKGIWPCRNCPRMTMNPVFLGLCGRTGITRII